MKRQPSARPVLLQRPALLLWLSRLHATSMPLRSHFANASFDLSRADLPFVEMAGMQGGVALVWSAVRRLPLPDRSIDLIHSRMAVPMR